MSPRPPAATTPTRTTMRPPLRSGAHSIIELLLTANLQSSSKRPRRRTRTAPIMQTMPECTAMSFSHHSLLAAAPYVWARAAVYRLAPPSSGQRSLTAAAAIQPRSAASVADSAASSSSSSSAPQTSSLGPAFPAGLVVVAQPYSSSSRRHLRTLLQRRSSSGAASITKMKETRMALMPSRLNVETT